MIITVDDYNKPIPDNIKVKRFDMDICFYEFVNIDGKNFLKVYFLNPAYKLWFPFFDDKNKEALEIESSATTYGELVEEFEQNYKINLVEKLILAKDRYRELVKDKVFATKESKNFVIYELKVSKSAKVYTLYKFFNYKIISTDADTETASGIKCKLIEVDNLPEDLAENIKFYIANEPIKE